jgi:hypothetical protein
MSVEFAERLFLAAWVAMAIHLLCTFVLRRNIEAESSLFDELFTEPLLGSLTRMPGYLRAKYFLPWVATPEDLADYTVSVWLTFWSARLAGMLFFVGLLGFLAGELYVGIRGTP